MKSKRHSARYFDWIDDLEGPPCARDALEDAFFLPAVESAARVAAWLAQWGSALDPTAVALIEAIPALFDGRTRDVAARVSFLERESARSSVSALTAEALFLAALARWRLEQPEGHWQAVLEDPRISKEPRVRARCLVEVAAARMNLGGLIDALAGIEAAASLAHAWDGWARTRALTVQFTSHLYLGDHAEAKRLLGELRPRGARDAKAPSVQLAHVRRALALAQERESLVEARRLLAAARGVGS
ncbi:MAG: hypothetical protein IOD12_11655, partial [Silvanigrellales bacterium]|nr:hypothetical protein [Silvanigrellales bacterium]